MGVHISYTREKLQQTPLNVKKDMISVDFYDAHNNHSK